MLYVLQYVKHLWQEIQPRHLRKKLRYHGLDWIFLLTDPPQDPGAMLGAK